MFNLKQYDWKKYNYSLVLLVLLLCITGVFFIWRSGNEDLVVKQIIGIVLGLFLIAILSVIDYHFICRFAIPLYIFNVFLLMLVKFTPLGVYILGATRWLKTGIIDIQPSELTKITLIICFAAFYTKYKDKMNNFMTLLLAALILIPPLLLIYMQPHLSTCIIIALIFISMTYLAGLSYKIIMPIIIVGVPSVLGLVWYLCQPFQGLISGPQQNRLLGFFNPNEYKLDINYQQNNSVSAIGTGQLYGKIFGDIPNGSRLNHVVTQNESDFIFSVIGEEIGFIGGCILIVIYAILIFKCLSIAGRAKDTLGRLLAFGITSMLMYQVFINIGVATAVLPNTGQPMPFVSYGLTTLICCMSGIGILLNISLQRKNTRG